MKVVLRLSMKRLEVMGAASIALAVVAGALSVSEPAPWFVLSMASAALSGLSMIFIIRAAYHGGRVDAYRDVERRMRGHG